MDEIHVQVLQQYMLSVYYTTRDQSFFIQRGKKKELLYEKKSMEIKFLNFITKKAKKCNWNFYCFFYTILYIFQLRTHLHKNTLFTLYHYFKILSSKAWFPLNLK